MPENCQTNRESGRSWVIALAGFFIYLFVSGSTRANGVFFAALVETQGLSRQAAFLPFIFPKVVCILAAPLTGLLSTILSPRVITFTGILVFCVGCSTCYFSTNPYFLAVFYGAVMGSGISISTGLIPGLINRSFKYNRATAQGIVSTGQSFGAFLFPMIITYFLEEYGIRGSFLLLGGLGLHATFGAMFFEGNPSGELLNNRKKISKPLECNETSGSLYLETKLFEVETPMDKKFEDLKNDNNSHSEVIYEVKDKIMPIDRGTILFDDPGHVERISPGTETKEPLIIRVELETPKAQQFVDNTKQHKIFHSKQRTYSWLNFKTSKYVKTASKRIFTSRGFHLISLTHIMHLLYLSTYNLLIVDYLVDKGIAFSGAVHMLTAFAAGQMAGRLGLGWLTDRNYISRQFFMMLTMFVCATITYPMTLVADLGLLLFFASLVGAVHGASVPVSNVMFSDYLPKEDVHLAVSFSRSLVGIASLFQTPLIGLFRDHLGSYDHLFHLVGSLSLLTSILWILELIRIKR